MNYCPQKDKLMISTNDAQSACFLLRHALKKLRLCAGLPLDKYETSGFLTEHDHAAIAIIEAANKLGIDFGVTPHNHNKLDLRDI
jgi:hypothetical protein